MRLIRVAGFVTPSVVAVGLFLFIFADGGRLAATVSPDAVWETAGENSSSVSTPTSPADSFRVALNAPALGQILARAPMQSVQDLRKSPAVLALPMPDGSFQRFHIEESPVLDADLAARYPAIKSYRGQGIDDGTATMRFDWTPLGFHALVLSADREIGRASCRERVWTVV